MLLLSAKKLYGGYVDNFLKAMSNAQLFRKTVDVINTDDTIVLLLANNLEPAIAYYGKVYESLPEFRILNVDDEREIKHLSEKFAVPVYSASRKQDYEHKKRCLYAPSSTFPWGKDAYNATLAHAQQLGFTSFFVDKRTVEKLILWGANRLPWLYFEENFPLFKEIFDFFIDKNSQDVYIGVLQSRLTGDSGYIPFSSFPQYHHPRVQIQFGDVVCEAGALNGDTALHFAKAVGTSGKVIAFDPLPEAYEISRHKTSAHTNIIVEEMGLWSSVTDMYLEPTETFGASYCTTHQSQTTLSCKMTDLDSYLKHNSERCDFLKMDIEGAELEALKGAGETLRKYRPKLAISVYHSPLKDFLYIPKHIKDLNLNYEFYLGHHSSHFIETVLYCIPK